MARSVVLILAFVTSLAGMLAGELRIVDDVWQGYPVKVVANTLRIRLQSGQAYTIDDAARLMPPGVRVSDQMLRPAQSRLMGQGLFRMGKGAMTDPLLRAEEALLRSFVVTVDGPIDLRRMAAKLASYSTIIETAEPWIVDQPQSTPDDPYVNDQAYLPVIRALDAWAIYNGAPSVVIAICDNGVDQQHEDLAGNLFTRTTEVPDNGVDDDNNGFVDDYRGYNLASEVDGTPGSTAHGESHGTEVAGLAGATWNNKLGIAGIGGRCTIFPLKASIRGSSAVVFGYQGIMYAAMQGFKVVNCSWGVVKPFSVIDQSVIDYANARGTLVVASAGNHGTASGGTPYDRNYPSSYRGVLGVGETTLLDRVTSTSGLGVNADIFAPGFQAYTTTTFNGYTSFGVQGTSFSSPMVAAAAALVRGKYPTLTPAQTAAVLRRSASSIAAANPSIQPGLAGRLDMVAALSQQPLGAPGIEITGYRLLAAGKQVRRTPFDVPLTLQLDLVNHLGPARGVVTEARIVARNGWDVALLTPNVEPVDIPSGATTAVTTASITIRTQGERPLMLAVRVAAEGSYEDEYVVMIEPESNMTTLSNGVLTYSIGDAGSLGVIGAQDARLGNSFVWSGGYWMMSPSGLVVTEGETLGVTGMNDIGLASDFAPIKPFVEPDTNVGVMSDAAAPDDRRIGVEVRTRATFHRVHPQATVLQLTLTNTSGRILNDVGMGYILDWDLGSGGNYNRSRFAPEAVPETFREAPIAAQVFYREVAPVKAAVMCGVMTSHEGARPQTAAFPWSDFLGDGLSSLEMVELLRNDASVQTDFEGDLAGMIGMRFPGALAPNEQRAMAVVFAVASTIDSAAAIMRDVIVDPTSVPVDGVAQVQLLPNPTADAVRVEHGLGTTEICIYDQRGVFLLRRAVAVDATLTLLDLHMVAAGMYHAVITGNNRRITLPLAIIR